MRHTELVRLVFDNPDGSASFNFTNIFFPVKQITITNAFYSSTQAQENNPSILVSVESNMTNNRKSLIILPINSYNTCPSKVYLDNAIDIIGNKTFWLNNIGSGTGYYGPYADTDTVCLLIEFYGFDTVNPVN